MAVWVCVYSRVCMCVCEHVSECTRNVLLCENGFFVAGVTHSRILKERNKKKCSYEFLCEHTKAHPAFHAFFSTIYVEGVSFLLTNIYILVRMLCACMCVQREQGESVLYGCVDKCRLRLLHVELAVFFFFFFCMFYHCARSVRGIKRPLYCTFFPCFKLRLRFSTLGSVLFFVCECSSLP